MMTTDFDAAEKTAKEIQYRNFVTETRGQMDDVLENFKKLTKEVEEKKKNLQKIETEIEQTSSFFKKLAAQIETDKKQTFWQKIKNFF